MDRDDKNWKTDIPRITLGKLLLLAGVTMMSLSMGVASAKEEIKSLERIIIKPSEERAQFIFKKSKKNFFVKGFNYVRLRGGDHATFDADTQTTKAHYDPKQAEAMFHTLSKSGYNTVRVFGAFDDHEKTFAAAVDNIVQVRDLANKENLNGMLFWTYDCQEQARLYHATDDWPLFYRKMGTFE